MAKLIQKPSDMQRRQNGWTGMKAVWQADSLRPTGQQCGSGSSGSSDLRITPNGKLSVLQHRKIQYICQKLRVWCVPGTWTFCVPVRLALGDPTCGPHVRFAAVGGGSHIAGHGRGGDRPSHNIPRLLRPLLCVSCPLWRTGCSAPTLAGRLGLQNRTREHRYKLKLD